MELEGRVALVTGASRGVGRAVAIALAHAGADVACAARATDTAPIRLPGTIDETVRTIEAAGQRGLAVPTNLADAEAVERMVHVTHEHFGRLDILINNAAITFAGDLEVPLKRYEAMMNVNLRAPFIATRTAVPHLVAQGGGAILNISAGAAIWPLPGMLTYGMTKAALERFTIDVARQLRSHHIAVNAFRIDVPVASEGYVANAPDADHSTWEPTDVAAEGVLWLLRQPAEYTGQVVSMARLLEEQGVMTSRSARRFPGFEY